jgi:hypothetical protein
MKNFIDFSANPIKKFKFIKLGKFRLSFTIVIILSFTALICLLSTISISDAEATYVRDGDFKISSAISSFTMFEGDNFNLTLFLTNTSATTQSVVFQGACQATWKILDTAGNQIYPINTENTPCNNRGFEEFMIYSNDVKRYYFSLVHTPGAPVVMAPGKYKIIGIIDGFGETEPKEITILERPKTTNAEGELCEGLTGRSCDKNLECKFEGGFPGGAGICMKEENNYEPKNRCRSGLDSCFTDIEDSENKASIEKFALLGRINGFEDGSFKPNDPIAKDEFYALVAAASNNEVKDKFTDQSRLNKEQAVYILYRAFIRQQEPRSLVLDPFVDTSESRYSNYIQASYNSGILFVNESRTFNPTEELTRAEAISLIDRFETYK